MGKPSWEWGWEGGYSRLLQTAELTVEWAGGNWRTEWGTRPAAWFAGKHNVEGSFRIRGPLTLRSPFLAWRLAPQAEMRFRLLPPASRYLGGFRVPQDHCAVHWRCSTTLDSDLGGGTGRPLVGVAAGSRLTWDWVAQFPVGRLLEEILPASWNAFADPFDPGAVASLAPGRLVGFRWSGRLRWFWTVAWTLGGSWDSGWRGPLLQWRNWLAWQAGVVGTASWRIAGSFELRIRRRTADLEVTVRREAERGREVAAQLGVELRRAASLRAREELLDPALRPVRDVIEEAVGRRLELLVAADWESGRSWQRLWRGRWEVPEEGPDAQFGEEYRRLLEGRFPERRPGFASESELGKLVSRRSRLRLRLFGGEWGREREWTERRTLRADPAGNLVLETETTRRNVSWSAERIQFLQLITSPHWREAGCLWYRGWMGMQTREELRRALRGALRVKVLEEAELWGGESSAPTWLVWLTEFTGEGLARIRSAGPETWWGALVWAWELEEPDLFGPGGRLRDWIDVPELGELVDRDPVQAYLVTRYPVAGRSEAERRGNVQSYLRAKGFLRLLQRWAEVAGALEPSELTPDAWEGLLGVPIFLVFHWLCPVNLRTSALWLKRGERSRWWGEPALAERLEAETPLLKR